MPVGERPARPLRPLDGLATVARRLGAAPRTRRLAGVVVLGIVALRLGVDQSLRAVGAIDARALAAALVLTALTTLCCAWRWSLVATGIGAEVPLRTALADCYRSQFLNTTTPGGVIGDLHRGVRHGRRTGDAGRGVRSVIWERTAGQVVQAGMALVVLSVLPSPVRAAVLWGCVVAAVCAVYTGLRPTGFLRTRFLRTRLSRTRLSHNRFRGTALPRLATARRPAGRRARTGVVVDWWREGRRSVLSRRTWPLVALASALAVTGHVLTFLVAARTAGSTASATGLVPLAFVVLLASGLPTNLAGWGPREGVAAWVFGAAGLGAGAGFSTAVVYGLLVLVASLPGAVVLVATHVRARASDSSTEDTTAASTTPPVVAPGTATRVNSSATTLHSAEVVHG